MIDMMKEFGDRAYFLWFGLIEICGDLMLKDQEPPYALHKSRLMRELKINQDKLDIYLAYLQDKLKISSTYVEDKYNIEIHNLPNYIGSYVKKQSDIKERKEKKSKDNTVGDSPPHWLLILWNEKANPTLPRVSLKLGASRKKKLDARLKDFPNQSDWEKIISKINQSPFLLGVSGDWSVSFDWLLKSKTNCDKILEGNYDNKKKQTTFVEQPNDVYKELREMKI